jgi:hypothetical protein
MLRRPAFAIPLACLLAWAALASGARAQSSSLPSSQDAAARAQMDTDLRLERKLLVLDLSSYREARTAEQRARDRFNTAATRLDEALAGNSVALGTVESLHAEVAAAREACQTAAERVSWQLSRLEDRLRRIGFLEGELGAKTAPVARDPITGHWRVTVLPQNQTGVWDLTLNGTLVTGTYKMDNGPAGSFRGTFSSGQLRLERIDASRGFDSVFLATIDSNGRLVGSWTANELASGQPSRGDWSAARSGS